MGEGDANTVPRAWPDQRALGKREPGGRYSCPIAKPAVGHLWNCGLNIWGWEDTPGGGDRDYSDLIVGLDFASASGHGWLA
jgi:hypothetical protein